MQYTSTRNNTLKIPSSQAITQGISRESGLFVPESLPRLAEADFASLMAKDYRGRASEILSRFLTDFTVGEIEASVNAAYSKDKFPGENPTPIVKLADGVRLLELWHGPTCAFKDMALQLLPSLLTISAKKEAERLPDTKQNETVILVATSGDTGKAALEGFKNVEGTRILVFYPQDGVSHVQKLQMASQDGDNVGVMGVYGNFDDAQTGVKRIFTNTDLRAKLEARGMSFSSANSINWGRLVPQIVYYISAYCDMINGGDISFGEKVNICVPTGNFGNILAAFYAKGMGLPVGKLICASNENKVLADFINTGTYDRRRELVPTSSPSMDILISSNLERLLFELCGKDSEIIASLMNGLAENGTYTVSDIIKTRLQSEFWGGFCTEAEAAAAIKQIYDGQRYLPDTHTAVALHVHRQYVRQTGDNTKTIVASTASPYKFTASILSALKGQKSDKNEFDQIDSLYAMTGFEPPAQIASLRDKPVRFNESVLKEDMACAVERMLGITK